MPSGNHVGLQMPESKQYNDSSSSFQPVMFSLSVCLFCCFVLSFWGQKESCLSQEYKTDSYLLQALKGRNTTFEGSGCSSESCTAVTCSILFQKRRSVYSSFGFYCQEYTNIPEISISKQIEMISTYYWLSLSGLTQIFFKKVTRNSHDDQIITAAPTWSTSSCQDNDPKKTLSEPSLLPIYH